MKKMIAAVGMLLIAGIVEAGTVRYLQDAAFDKQATFGVSQSSDAILNLKNSTDTNVVTIRSSGTDSSFTLYLPKKLGVTGQALLVDSNGQMHIGSATVNTEDVQDIAGGMVSGNTEVDITVTYDDGAGKLDFSVDATITRDTEWDTIGEVESIWGFDVITSTQIDTIAEFEAVVGTNVVTMGENNVSLGHLTVTSLTSNEDVKIKRDKKLILNNDATADSYITQETGGNIRFFRNNVEYMRFE